MADIKDFVKKHTTPVSIGTPRDRKEKIVDGYKNVALEQEAESNANISRDSGVDYEYGHNSSQKKIGRPRNYDTRSKLSVYVPSAIKDQLIRIQHQNYRQSLNDVLTEAVNDLIKKYQ